MGAGTPLRRAGGPSQVDDGPGVDGTLVEVARAAVAGSRARGGDGDWTVAVEGFWCTVRPPGRELPAQGWKLHVSAASSVAVEVLSAVAAAVADDPCAFKFTADREKLHELNSRNSERGSAGKFLTVYPGDDEQFRRLAEELHRATAGMPGPVILSDRPYRPGSLVHYRYGAFAGRSVLGNDGAYRSMLRAPGGALVEDVRGAVYRRPPWVADPVEGAGSTTGGGRAPGGVLLDGRWALTAALRHGAKGGVFLGSDRITGAEVVVKQARAHIEVDRAGTDARTALRHEAELLGRLADSGLTPRVHALVEQQDSLFLVQDRVPGQALGSWVAARLRRDGTPDVPWAEAGPMALALLDLVERVHRRGLVLRDLSPGNVLVTPDGDVRLVDLELAVPAGVLAGSAGTPGYRAPEHSGPHRTGRAARSTDLYALGGLYFLLATGHDPLLPDDLPQARPVADRLGRWLALAARGGDTARRLAPLVLGLRAEAADRRWSLERVRTALAAGAAPGTTPAAPVAPPPLDRLLHDGLRLLARSATPQRPDRLWPTVPGGLLTDPCNVQHGAAGVLALLARAARAPLPGPARERARATAAVAAAWVERRCAAEPVVLPGLHFGRAGTAWALFDAAEALDDPGLAERAAGLTAKLPLDWPNPDVCHGVAGAGLAQLRAHRATGARTFLDRTARCVHRLLAAARDEPYGTVWPVPADFDSALAGATHLGHAHGVAGVGAFLLAAAGVLADGGDPALAATAADARAGADRAARTLAATARSDGPAAWWPQSHGDPEHVRLAHWCSGSSGVGSFLVRHWLATGDPDSHRLALAAGRAVLDARWHSGVTACHGLAGNGEYLLDLAEATGEGRFRHGARDLAALIAARTALRDDLLVLPDETGTTATPAYGTGTAGPLAFLLRLRHGGPRMWSP
ncbi:protein kinase/lanthionine synthetase C family protein [Kitasatospora sp. NA04385]|uniref:class IV lanthionine synthetase LanL n=1 Tax=Kitasatospora sp. NA04385 TaxID=2742135 RepID=UPI00159063D9|nr:class IV lanthionine synthetase LanL [Kitasatospora sp. NA04385]QKW19378.1 protein kinase/lanthionine synthetase C family protein [Kitasatospora sp. NA04385]